MEMTDRLSIVLEVKQWNEVLETLHNAPFRLAAPIIGEIMRQVQETEMRQTMATRGPEDVPAPIPATANGAAHAEA
jgi:hypothetical protein